jgi:hypothetical protein
MDHQRAQESERVRRESPGGAANEEARLGACLAFVAAMCAESKPLRSGHAGQTGAGGLGCIRTHCDLRVQRPSATSPVRVRFGAHRFSPREMRPTGPSNP